MTNFSGALPAPTSLQQPAAIRTERAEPPPTTPDLDALVQEIIARVADKWTMLALEVLTEHGRLRFTRLAELVSGVSQKMLTKTLRQMEQDGLVTRTVYPVIPPRVEYELTEMGLSLSAAFCGVWVWAEQYQQAIEGARRAFAQRSGSVPVQGAASSGG
ncbi:winged helix-turn-helix transcriptional regulator [Deinococcus sp.]|uniref:winged helix-turn-helix transcriptional regulator n=1 Tax=Deinococcus sp. TaxID=47478 RepID=UPI003CC609BC